ncbi:MAG: T9SS type A sorting domain-containing protein [Flavobacteriales bacterium]|nr:T9SS type A sorting domain-containing protein [Flavobacteriales bacterium]
MVTIQLINNNSKAIELYNVIGERLTSEQINQSRHSIDISNYPNGVYFLKVDGNITKIIKQ